MFLISNHSATVAYSFHFTTFYSSTPGRNKKNSNVCGIRGATPKTQYENF